MAGSPENPGPVDLTMSVVTSLDGQDPRLLPYLPELLQDLERLGADPALVEGLLRHGHLPSQARILDLGCGKGAVTLHLLQRHPWEALGLDALPAFVEAAQLRAEKLGLSERCSFQVADIRTWTDLETYDVVILGALGPVLGPTRQTLEHVAPFLKPNGKVVLDETYIRTGVQCRNPIYRSREALMEAIAQAGFRILGEARSEAADMEAEDAAMFEAIQTRAEALGHRYPGLASVFAAYVEAQAREFQVLEEEVENVTLLLEPKP